MENPKSVNVLHGTRTALIATGAVPSAQTVVDAFAIATGLLAIVTLPFASVPMSLLAVILCRSRIIF